METTVDLPDDLHALVTAIADRAGLSPSETVVRLLRDAVPVHGPSRVSVDPSSGLPVFSGGRTITSEDVRSLEDED